MGRVTGVIRRPKTTFEAVASSPRWAAVLAALFMVNTGVNIALVTTDVGRQALVDQWERTAVAFGHEVDAARYAEFRDFSRHGPAYVLATQLVRGPMAVLFLAALLHRAFRRWDRRTSYRQVLAVVVYSTVILTIRELVAAPVNYLRESISSPTTLAQMFPFANSSSPAARFFGVVDLFVVWWIGVLAIGLGVLYSRRAWPIGVALYGVYAGVALVLAATIVWLGTT